MRPLKFSQVDVFTTTPFTGNPAAVILDARGLTNDEMQAIAREMNLSETTFVLPPVNPDADYLVRFFSPRSELPFAGHPTLATVAALIHEGRLFNGKIPEVIQQESGIGIVPILVEKKSGSLFFVMTQAQPQWDDTDISLQQSAAMLGCDVGDLLDLPAQIVSTGVDWLIIPIASLTAIQTLRPHMDLIEQICKQKGAYGITVFCLAAQHPDHQIHARSFAPGAGVPEDPVCGTGNGSIAAYLAKQGLMDKAEFEYIAEQGAEVGRPGKVMVRAQHLDNIWKIQVGGQAIQVLDGNIIVPS